MFRSTIAALAIASAMGGLLAARAEADTGGKFQDWEAYYGTVAGIPGPSCIATTRAGRMSLTLVATPSENGPPELYSILSDPRWNLRGEVTTYLLDLEDVSWTFKGWGSGEQILNKWDDTGKFLRYMEHVASRELVTAYTDDHGFLMRFSLDGSRSATIALERCVKSHGDSWGGPMTLGPTFQVDNIRDTATYE